MNSLNIGLTIPKLNKLIVGNGETYRGSANKGESGTECQIWKDSPYLSFVLDQDKIANLGDALNGNFCRNPDGDAGPWCIAPNGEFDYCDIPACGSNSSTILFPDDSPGDIGSKLSNLHIALTLK